MFLPPKIIKRSVEISGHKTSVSLEQEFWEALKEISLFLNVSMASIIRQIDQDQPDILHKNLSSSIRVFILNFYKNSKNK
jgi:predicted DNA-binding ribbon-helix-helix protein